MSWLVISLVVLFLVIVFWQFGGRLSARYAISWWFGAAFLLFCTIFPHYLQPLLTLLGIQVISNFVMAGLLLFLFFQSIDLTSDLSRTQRMLRLLVCEEAVNQKPKQTSSQSGKTLVVLPCYNEEASLPKTLQKLQSIAQSSFDFLVVNDGSGDRSEAILLENAAEHLVSHRVNIGVAGVLITGFSYAKRMGYSAVLQCDSDGQHPFEKIPEIIEVAKNLNADLLIGSRFSSGQKDQLHSTTPWRWCGILLLRASLSLFGRSGLVSDPTSGFRVYSRRAMDYLLRHMPDEYPEPESVALCSLANLKVAEHPVVMLPRMAGASSLSGFKQIRYFAKVTSALLGLRLRYLFKKPR